MPSRMVLWSMGEWKFQTHTPPHSDCWQGIGRTPLCPRHDQILDRRIPDQRFGQSNCTVQVFLGTTNFTPIYWHLHRPYDQFVTSTNTQPTHPPKPQPHLQPKHNHTPWRRPTLRPSICLSNCTTNYLSRSIINILKEGYWMQLHTEIILNVRYRCIVFIYYWSTCFFHSQTRIIRISEKNDASTPLKKFNPLPLSANHPSSPMALNAMFVFEQSSSTLSPNAPETQCHACPLATQSKSPVTALDPRCWIRLLAWKI